MFQIIALLSERDAERARDRIYWFTLQKKLLNSVHIHIQTHTIVLFSCVCVCSREQERTLIEALPCHTVRRDFLESVTGNIISYGYRMVNLLKLCWSLHTHSSYCPLTEAPCEAEKTRKQGCVCVCVCPYNTCWFINVERWLETWNYG